jgi:hypothetical protein
VAHDPAWHPIGDGCYSDPYAAIGAAWDVESLHFADIIPRPFESEDYHVES